MKKTLLLITFVFGLSYSAFAGACANTSLSVYEGSMFSCNIGDLTFSDFTSSNVATTNMVATVMGPEAGLDFTTGLSETTTALSSSETATIDYTVTCTLCSFDDWELETGSVTSTGSGTANVLEQSAPGALDEFTGAPGNVSSTGTFSPNTSPFTVTTTITLGGGTTGTTTTLGSVTTLFSSTSTVPEPSSLILCAGLLGLLPLARRKFVR